MSMITAADTRTSDPADTPDVLAVVADLRVFGAATTMLGNLSRYVDNAATAMLAGDITPAELAGYLQHVKAVYASLREKVIAALCDDARAEADTELWVIPADADVLTTALLVDQSLAWTASLLQVGNLARQIRIAKMNLDLEEHAASERFRDTVGGPKRTPAGLYA